MIVGLSIKPLWSDVDVFEVAVSGSNGEFGGSAAVYVGIDGLAEAASMLEGFPRTTSDMRQFELGTFDSSSAGGGVQLRFSCVDGAGHAIVEVRIASEAIRDSGVNLPAQSATFFAPIEASGVDDFAAELRQLEIAKTGTAYLRFLKPNN